MLIFPDAGAFLLGFCTTQVTHVVYTWGRTEQTRLEIWRTACYEHPRSHNGESIVAFVGKSMVGRDKDRSATAQSVLVSVGETGWNGPESARNDFGDGGMRSKSGIKICSPRVGVWNPGSQGVLESWRHFI